ncbi:MAG: type I-C CRISPR-associated endonuclease Cas1 [Clostridiaceae bacterium]|nr:type I-C CRISPR-associated endonuclease Cas1 [Clostridiaceae bacterium]
MKKLLNTLYVTSEDTYLSLDGENIVVLKEGKEAIRLPFHNIEGVVSFGRTGASPALMGYCAKNNVSLTFLNSYGRFLARVTGEIRGNIVLRKKQYILSEDTYQSTLIAKNFITGKVYNCKSVVDRANRDYGLRLDTNKLQDTSQKLNNSIQMLRSCNTLEEVRGFEGEAAKSYFAVFDELILQQKDYFYFNGRNKRPPLDNVNAMLSFLYTLLAHDVAAALENVGLDPYCGFLHRDRPGRISLALDLMEELRPVLVDRTVLSLINNREVSAKGFIQKESGAVIMDEKTRKIILNAWQTRKKDQITHPFLKEKIPWGIVPHAQSMLLARHLRGDLEEYPPFFWK